MSGLLNFPLSVNAQSNLIVPEGCVYNIMPMGDSITAGYTNAPSWSHKFNFGYRAHLYEMLINSGCEIDYMGSSTEPTSVGTYNPDFDLRAISQDNHHGYGGQSVVYLNDNISTWLSAEVPDIILLHIGTNGQLTTQLNTFVDFITTNYPTIHLIVAQIIPNVTYSASIVSYNNYIRATLVPLYQSQGKNVTTVNMYAPFLTDKNDLTSIDSSLFSNGINHPDDDGYYLMAEEWVKAINLI